MPDDYLTTEPTTQWTGGGVLKLVARVAIVVGIVGCGYATLMHKREMKVHER